MCYSAQVWSDYRKYCRAHPGARVDFESFLTILRRNAGGEKLPLPKGVTDPFKVIIPSSALEEECQDLVLSIEAARRPALQEKLFAQRQRLADAERKLETKFTKSAEENKRIATNQIEDILSRLQDLNRTQHEERDDRIFSMNFCPVLTMGNDGQLVVRLARYHLRQPGMKPSSDTQLRGNYNARRDNLTGFWRRQFGHTHGVVYAQAFFENVKAHNLEHRQLAEGEVERNVRLKFSPSDGLMMPLACVFAHWRGKEEPDLLSFAIITDDPPPEVAAAGHDRCPIPIQPENVLDWLSPGAAPQHYDDILSDKLRPYYSHALLAA